MKIESISNLRYYSELRQQRLKNPDMKPMRVVETTMSQQMKKDKDWRGPCSSRAAMRVRNQDHQDKVKRQELERSEICPFLAQGLISRFHMNILK